MHSFVCVFHSLPLHHTPGFMCPPPKSRDKNLHRKDTWCSFFTARPTFLPASLPHSPASGILSFVCVCVRVCVCVCVCVCVFKVLVIFPWSPCLYSGPRNLVVQVIGSNKGANRVSRQCLRIFLFVKLAVKLEECMGSEIKLDNFAINEQLVSNVQVKRLCKTEHLKWCLSKCA